MKYRRFFSDEERRKAKATRTGVSVAEYDALLAAGKKWCWPCRTWHDRTEFGPDRSTSDGLQAMCRTSKRAYLRDWARESRALARKPVQR